MRFDDRMIGGRGHFSKKPHRTFLSVERNLGRTKMFGKQLFQLFIAIQALKVVGRTPVLRVQLASSLSI